MRRFTIWPQFMLLASVIGLIGTGPAPSTGPASAPTPVLIHLPGIAGELPIDHALVAGLVAGGVAPKATIIDWTGTDRGVPALTHVERHTEQAKRLSDAILAVHAQNPTAPIILVGHSGGTGVAVNALENLPADVHVQTLVLLASALSPGYDLSAALRHVDGHCYSFNSELDDWVLGTGTKTFGTYDRQFVEAAGKVGFSPPKAADPAAYAKLTQIPYDPAWVRLGNGGDHVGPTSRAFAKLILAPLIEGKGLLKLKPLPPTTVPVK